MQEIKDVIVQKNKDKEMSDAEKIDIAKKITFHLFLFLAASQLKRISSSVGHEKLYDIYKDVLKKNDILSVHLIDLSIKLEHGSTIPIEDIKTLISVKKLDSNIFGLCLMRLLIVNRLYMFPTDIGTKQKLVKILNMPIAKQLAIEESSSSAKSSD